MWMVLKETWKTLPVRFITFSLHIKIHWDRQSDRLCGESLSLSAQDDSSGIFSPEHNIQGRDEDAAELQTDTT